MMTDYKKYSLENLETWLYDAMSCGDATPQEIYDTIIKVVKDEYCTYTKRASESYELLTLLNEHTSGESKMNLTYDEMIAAGYTMTADGFWIPPEKTDQVNRWVLPVQVDGLTGECYINLPDDLLERAGLQEGTMVNFIDRGDGSFEMRKVS